MSFDFNGSPIDNFLGLYKEAQVKGIPDANAMSLATVDKQNNPQVRVVLFKGLKDGGFTFFTNYNGSKATQISLNPNVALGFFWSQLDRQVRVSGKAVKLSRSDNESYFSTRPRQSQLGAWASDQSQKLSCFEDFHKRFQKVDEMFQGKNVECPENWGGYVVQPLEIEFWFGKSGRLHERYVYQKNNQNDWDRFLRFP